MNAPKPLSKWTPASPVEPTAPWTSAGCSAGGVTLFVSTHQALLTLGAAASGDGCVSRVSNSFGHYYGAAPVAALQAAGAGSTRALLVGSQGRLSRPRRAARRSLAAGRPSPRNASAAPPGLQDALLLLDPEARSVLGWWALPTVYLHDSVLSGSDLFSVDTDSGRVLRFRVSAGTAAAPMPPSALPLSEGGWAAVEHVRSYESSGAPRAAHANGLTLGLGRLWVMHNNLASRSAVQLVDAASGALGARLPLGGANCHSPLFYRGRLLYLLSASGGLGRLHPNGTSDTLWAAGARYFSKGLAVVDDIAYLAVALRQRAAVERNFAASEVAAFDLLRHVLLWRRPLPFPGLVNSLTAPRVGPGCSWRACATGAAGEAAESLHAPREAEWAAALRAGPTQGGLFGALG